MQWRRKQLPYRLDGWGDDAAAADDNDGDGDD